MKHFHVMITLQILFIMLVVYTYFQLEPQTVYAQNGIIQCSSGDYDFDEVWITDRVTVRSGNTVVNISGDGCSVSWKDI